MILAALGKSGSELFSKKAFNNIPF